MLSARSTFGWLWQVLLWLVILGVLSVLSVAVLVPRLTGATPYTVLTGSMEPRYPPGTLVVVKPVDVDDVSIGDVITYQLESGRPTVVTHRVVGVANRFDGTSVLVTQGDANDDPDPVQVEPAQVRGKLWYSVPYVGYVNRALSGSQRQWAVLATSAALIGYAANMFVGALRDRRRRRTGVPQALAAQPEGTSHPVAPPAGPPAPAPPEQQHRLGPAIAGSVLLAVIALIALIVRRHHKQKGRGSS